MSTDFSVTALVPHVPHVVTEVFRTMLDLPIEPVEGNLDQAGELVTAAVLFVGEWNGAIILECPLVNAFEFTRRFMKTPLPAALDDDVRDTLGELANMVAGNLKGVMPHGVVLSMPSVVAGSDYSLRLCGVVAREAQRFTGDGVAIQVVLVEMTDSRAGRTEAS